MPHDAATPDKPRPSWRDGLPPPPPGPAPESHFAGSQTVRDIVIGVADGLTVPFALAAGLAGTVASNPLIVTAGLAVIAAGCVAKGMGGLLAARTEIAHYAAERRREAQEIHDWPDRERWEVLVILHRQGLRDDILTGATDAICADPDTWVDFMMRFELEMTEPESGLAQRSAMAMGGAYVAGGLIPLLPYMLFSGTRPALILSAVLTAVALTGFGWLKARATGLPPGPGAAQALGVGVAAAALAFVVAGVASR
ncbi:VIT1/CCC1 transporter family protein [Humitalea sp. 24SJ18S-53]|uniref:VIT1/CCC1 transporter family protein n=1 Tax=Humitalea sp. 24SJ18S-53 TaxID=3422307 RepID=UPI003D66B3AA